MKPFNLFPYDSNLNFMRLRYISLGIATLIMVVAIGAMALKSFNFALDFTGGTVTELHFAKPANVDAVRQRLAAGGFTNAQVQSFGSANDLLIRLQTKSGSGGKAAAQTAEDILRVASMPDNEAVVTKSDFVGPQVGKELALNGLYALLFVLLGFLIYISFRFELKFAIAAIITTLHDVILVCGWFAISRHEFDLTVLAGVLAVMGFSINDTIVVFDRVRENFRGMRAAPIEVMNRSVNQTLSRTIITSFVAFLSMLALYLFGGASLRGLAEAQIIGVLIGTLSSIFVACPLLLMMNVTKQDLMPKSKDEAALARRP
ncbi:protein translocase subunit SecF [Cognatiluteimonas profundi]|uniref:protein translocase subunit SecF n=1 Tax=Cognatiluteimonas profundi TaxID=2594501 RepID=UPI00131BDC0F|nr:protein translocase subunit SecF [Lysobacter profundi]